MIKFNLNTLLSDNTLKSVSKKREEYLEAINKETERITKLVTSMLELTQLEAGRKELNISEIWVEVIPNSP